MSRNKGVTHVYITRSLRQEARKKSTFHIKFYTETVEQSEVL